PDRVLLSRSRRGCSATACGLRCHQPCPARSSWYPVRPCATLPEAGVDLCPGPRLWPAFRAHLPWSTRSTSRVSSPVVDLPQPSSPPSSKLSPFMHLLFVLACLFTVQPELFSHGCYQRSEEHTSELQSPCNLVC